MASAVASTDKDNPTLLPLDQQIRVPANAIGTRYYAVDLRAGQSVTIFAQNDGSNNSEKPYLNVDAPGQQIDDLFYDKGMFIHDNNWIQLTSPVTGRYVIALSPGSSAVDLAVYQSFAEPGVAQTSRAEYFSNFTSRYLPAGESKLEHVGLDQVFRFEARQGDTISIVLQQYSGNRLLHMIVEAFVQRTEGFDYKESVPSVEGPRLQFTANVTGLYFVRISDGDYSNTTSATSSGYTLTVSGIRPDSDDDQDGLSNTAEYFQGTDPQQTDTNQNGHNDYQDIAAGRSGRLPVSWSHDDMAGAGSAATAKTVPYFDKPLHFWSLSLIPPRYLTASLRGNYVYERVTTKLGLYGSERGFCDLTTSEILTPSLPVSTLWSGCSNGHYEKSISYDWAIYHGFANPDISDQHRQYSNSRTTAFYLRAGEFDPRNVSVQRFEARAGERVRFNVTALKYFSTRTSSVYATEVAVYAGKDPAAPAVQHYGDSGITSGTPISFDFIAAKTDVYFLVVKGEGRYRTELEQVRADADDDQDGLSNTTELYRGLDPANNDTNGNGVSDADDIRQGNTGLYAAEWHYNRVRHATTKEQAVEVPVLNQKFSIDEVDGWFWLKIPVKANQPFAVLLHDKIVEVMPQKDGWHYIQSRINGPGKKVIIGVFMGFSSNAPATAEQFSHSFYNARPLTADWQPTNPGLLPETLSIMGPNFFRFEGIANQPVTLTLQQEDIAQQESLRMTVFAPLLNSAHTSKYAVTQRNLPFIVATDLVSQSKPQTQLSFTPAVSGTYYLNFASVNFAMPSAARFRVLATGVPPERDSDQDGLSNTVEYMLRTDPFQADTNQNGVSDFADLTQNGYPQLDLSLHQALQQQGQSRETALPLPAFNREYLLKSNTPRYISFYATAGEYFHVRSHAFTDAREVTKGTEYNTDQISHVTAWLCQNPAEECLYIDNFDFPIRKTGHYVLKLQTNDPDNTADTLFAVYQGNQNENIYDDSRSYDGSPYTAKQLQPGYYQLPRPLTYFRFDGKKGVPLRIRLTIPDSFSAASGKISAAVYNSAMTFVVSAKVATGQDILFTPTHDQTYYYELMADISSLPGVQIDISGIEPPRYPIGGMVQPAGAGTVSCTPATVSYGQNATCEVLPAAGYQFSHWQQTACGSSTQCALNAVVRPHQLQAFFRAIYALNVSLVNPQGGQLIAAPSQLLAGDTAIYRFAPQPGYRVSRKVGGDCPAGRWTAVNQYEVGPLSTSCQLSFSFDKIPQSTGLPWWVLFATPQQ